MIFKLIETRFHEIFKPYDNDIIIEINTIDDLKDLYDKYSYELAIDFNRMVIEIINGYRE